MAPAADHVKVTRGAMVLLAGSQPLPAESRHGPSRGAGVISPIAASSRNFTPSLAAGCFFADVPTCPGCRRPHRDDEGAASPTAGCVARVCVIFLCF